MKRGVAVFLISGAVLLIFMIAQPAQSQTPNTISASTVQLNIGLLNLLPPATTTEPRQPRIADCGSVVRPYLPVHYSTDPLSTSSRPKASPASLMSTTAPPHWVYGDRGEPRTCARNGPNSKLA